MIMPKKSKKTSKSGLESKPKKRVKKQEVSILQKKPNLDEFLKQASDWYDRWGNLCTGPLRNKQAYLDYQKMFYLSTLSDMTDVDYHKFVDSTTKNVVGRFNKIIESTKDLTKKK